LFNLSVVSWHTGVRNVLQSVKHLTTLFNVKGGLVRQNIAKMQTVAEISFELCRGQTLSFVGK
jgi:ABC-type microcin C transport system duplicated ATPase subunit YejF